MDFRLARYKGINFFKSSLSVLSLVNIRLPRKFYYYLLRIPTIRHLELSRVTVEENDAPRARSLILRSIFSLNSLNSLQTLTLESLRVHDLEPSLLAEVLEATRRDKLLKLSIESPCQGSRIFQGMLLLQNITSLTLSWETRDVRFPVMLFPRLQYLDVLHSHVGVFLPRNHQVKTLKLREFKPSTFQHIPMTGPPVADLGAMLAPAVEFDHGLESTFSGIKSLQISVYALTCDVRVPIPDVSDADGITVVRSSSLDCHILPTCQRLLHQSQHVGDFEFNARVSILHQPIASVSIRCWSFGTSLLRLWVP